VKNLKIILIVLGSIITLSVIAFFLIGYLKPKGAGLLIETVPNSTVFIDGVQVGRTSYEITRASGEITVKLVPESLDKPYAPFETKVTLSPGIKTIIRREFGETEETSKGEVVSFEKMGGSQTSLAVISIPDAAQVSIDGQVRGFTPYKPSSITAGEHQVKISAPNYSEKTLSIKTLAGYKLIAVVKLASNGEAATPSAQIGSLEQTKTMIEILTTPTGFLRVRGEPTSSASEVTQVKPGQKFPYVETDQKTGWFKIEYQPASGSISAKVGWVSNQYAKKIEESATSSPTPSPKP
jgi:uncharacterized protein YgiM (DUF1202 family)